jgi:hypothetical protein
MPPVVELFDVLFDRMQCLCGWGFVFQILLLNSHVERETELGNNCCTGYCCSDCHVEKEASYLPRIIITVFEMNNFDFWQQFLHDGNNANKELLIVVSIYRLYMISFFINPIVYSVMDLQFRKELRV